MSNEEVFKFDENDFLPDDTREASPGTTSSLTAAPVSSLESRVPHVDDSRAIAAAKVAMHIGDSEIPREMMWARLRQQRERSVVADNTRLRVAGRRRSTMRGFGAAIAAIAATLAIGIGIGRYTQSHATDTVAVSAPGDSAAVAALRASDPAVIAMEEHFARTVSLLSTVRDENPDVGPTASVSGWARELLGTTRMLLDEPKLHDAHTRRLLQDLELVLIQIVQARGTTAPEAKRAPSETMRETNLLPRVRAAVTAAAEADPSFLTGAIE